MDSMDPNLASSIQKMSDKDKQELQTFINAETQKAQIQSAVHALTDTCFKKCITSRISSGALDRNEESCTKNCVDRYMDANMLVVRHFQQISGGMQ